MYLSGRYAQWAPSENTDADPLHKCVEDAAPTAQQDEEVPVEVEEPADDDKAEKKAH